MGLPEIGAGDGITARAADRGVGTRRVLRLTRLAALVRRDGLHPARARLLLRVFIFLKRSTAELVSRFSLGRYKSVRSSQSRRQAAAAPCPDATLPFGPKTNRTARFLQQLRPNQHGVCRGPSHGSGLVRCVLQPPARFGVRLSRQLFAQQLLLELFEVVRRARRNNPLTHHSVASPFFLLITNIYCTHSSQSI